MEIIQISVIVLFIATITLTFNPTLAVCFAGISIVLTVFNYLTEVLDVRF